MANMPSECAICARSFGTYSGLRLHQKRAHPAEFNESVDIVRVSRRWSREEMVLLAQIEVGLRASPAVPLQRTLAARFPSRSFDSIKGVRRTTAYQGVLAELLESSSDSGPSLPSTVPPADEALLAALAVDGRALGRVDPAYCPGALLRAIDAQVAGRDCGLFLVEWADGVFPDRFAPPSRVAGGIPEVPMSARTRRRLTYARVQRLWCSDRAAIAREILASGAPPSRHSLADMETFWRPVFEEPSAPWGDHSSAAPLLLRPDGLWGPVSDEEIMSCYPRVASSPGPDGVPPTAWRRVPVPVLRSLFNLVMLRRSMPADFLRARTSLLPKVPVPADPSQYRPITVASVFARHFHKILAARLARVVPHVPEQRGFITGLDGLARNVHELDQIIRTAWSKRKPLYMAKLDVSKAFDSVSHYSIVGLLRARGFPQAFVQYIEDCFLRSRNILSVGGVHSAPVHPGRGVRQGDPLSSVLFNIVMDHVIGSLPERLGVWVALGRPRVRAMAYADDLLLFASSRVGLAAHLRAVGDALEQCGLSINPTKSEALILEHSGRQKLVRVDTDSRFEVDGRPLKCLGILDTWHYLGVLFGARGIAGACPGILPLLGRVDRAPLKPQQKLEMLRVHVIPSLLHALVLGGVKRRDLSALDVQVRSFVRRWLYLPHDCPNSFIHAPRTHAGLGIPCLTALIPAYRTQRFRSFVEHDEDTAGPSSPVLDSKEAIARKLFDTVDGRDLAPSPMVRASTDWLRDRPAGRMSGRDFVQFVRLISGSIPTRMRTSRGRRGSTGELWCRCGCSRAETLAHVVQVCPRTRGGRILRHHAVVRFLAKSFKLRRYQVHQEVWLGCGPGSHRPDLILVRGDTARILDVQVVSPVRPLDELNDLKIARYNVRSIKERVSGLFGVSLANITVGAVTLSWKGLWSKASAAELLVLGLVRGQLGWVSERVVRGSHMNWSRWNVIG